MGNAIAVHLIFRIRSVHPHVHGERVAFLISFLTAVRFIPTCMGNASHRRYGNSDRTVHPHVHGERLKHTDCQDIYVGSSPRAWGTLPNHGLSLGIGRFIPTCMGNASAGRPFLPGRPVHPHVHGERIQVTQQNATDSGSSPRAWGTPPQAGTWNPCLRFIPTCMGNAFWPRNTFFNLPVHPHVHGERRSWIQWGSAGGGSSPRAWGTHIGGSAPGCANRFIPTCMGNAISRVIVLRWAAVHPHVHGERASIGPGDPV